MSKMLRFFPCLITSPVFPHLSSVVTTDFGPRNWPLKAGRLANTKSGSHSRIITVSVGVVHCAHVLCVISFHYSHTASALYVLHPEAPTVAICGLFSSGDAAGETCE